VTSARILRKLKMPVKNPKLQQLLNKCKAIRYGGYVPHSHNPDSRLESHQYDPNDMGVVIAFPDIYRKGGGER